MAKKILLTGSSGFLGQHVLDQIGSRDGILLETFSFRCNESYQNKIEELNNKLVENNYDYIINAGSSQSTKDDIDNLKELIISNIFFPSSILSVIDKSNLKTHFINFGSAWEFDEKGKKMPFNAYAASKSACESFFKHYAQKNLKITNIYLYDTYGPNDKRNKVINLVIDAMIKNEDLNMSSCEQMMDLIYIDDVISSLEFIISSKFNQKYPDNLNYFELRNDNPITLNEIISKMKLFFPNYTSRLNKGFYPYRERERFKLKTNEFKLDTGLNLTDLETGLKKTINSRKNDQNL